MEQDHKDKAEELLDKIADLVKRNKANVDVSLASATEAQVHATLALVEALDRINDTLINM